MEKSRKECEEVCDRAPLSFISKVRRILPALKFRGEWSHSLGVGCCGLFSFLSAFLPLLSLFLCADPKPV